MRCMPSEKHRCRETIQRIKTLNPDWKLGWRSNGFGSYTAKITVCAGWQVTGHGQTLFAAINRANLRAIQLTQPLNLQESYQ